ncbi:MAG: hypothetical protein AB1711_07675 [Thermodesulfobacteriota bacterium]
MSIIPGTLTEEDFDAQLFQFISEREGPRKKVYADSKGIPTIGIGYALVVNINGEWQVRTTLETDLAGVEVTIQESDKAQLSIVAEALTAGNQELARSLVENYTFSFSLPSDKADELFDSVIPDYENKVRERLGDTLYQQLANSEEMVTLVSLAYNNPCLIGTNLVNALESGNRAEAWYEIRYQSNGGDSKSIGIANRRYRESDQFGLYSDDDNITVEEAKEALEMYERHRGTISYYENTYKPNNRFYNGKTISEIVDQANNILQAAGETDFLTGLLNSLDNFALELPLTSLFGDMVRKLVGIFKEFFTAAAPLPNVSPIVLDLDGDGVETANVRECVYFDHDGNGFNEQTGWAAPDDGILVSDRNGDGIINDGKEVFGNQTILEDGTTAANGFQALADLDDNLDGKIDAGDAAWTSLKVWQDVDGDGFSAADEFHTLDELGIQSINTGYVDSTFIDAQGNEHRQIGSFTKTDGTTGTATDVWFLADKAYTIATEWLDVPPEIAALPDLQGYGHSEGCA